MNLRTTKKKEAGQDEFGAMANIPFDEYKKGWAAQIKHEVTRDIKNLRGKKKAPPSDLGKKIKTKTEPDKWSVRGCGNLIKTFLAKLSYSFLGFALSDMALGSVYSFNVSAQIEALDRR